MSGCVERGLGISPLKYHVLLLILSSDTFLDLAECLIP